MRRIGRRGGNKNKRTDRGTRDEGRIGGEQRK
jgi:hypothetical protein